MDQKLMIGAVVVIVIIAAIAYVMLGTGSVPARQQSTTVPATPPPAPTTVANVTPTSEVTTISNATGAPNTTTSYSVNIWANSTIRAQYLTNSTGWTLYRYTLDTPYSANSACYGECMIYWAPFYVGTNATYPPSINASQFGTITRQGGALQTTYQGWPLYFYIQDKAPGQINGQGIGGTWYVVSPSARAQ